MGVIIYRSRGAMLVIGLATVAAVSPAALAIHTPLQNATATHAQGGFSVSTTINNQYPLTSAGGEGWGIFATPTVAQTAVFETTADVVSLSDTTLRFNLFSGGFGTHTPGKYRISYTTDDRSTFADGLTSGGDVTANWTVLKPTSALSSGGATLTIQPDGSVLASGANPELATDTIYAKAGQLPTGITGFRLELLEDPSLPTSGPGRSANGNVVHREFDVARFDGDRVALQNGTAQRSQFSVDNMINGDFDFENIAASGWANNGPGANIATMETVTDITGGATKLITAEIMSGGFGIHEIGKFRISATTADRSLFADGNDNGGAGVGNEAIWTVLDPETFVSDNASTTLLEDLSHAILATGTPAEYEHYTMTFRTTLEGITGFRLEALTDPTLPSGGPGRPANGNFVLREFHGVRGDHAGAVLAGAAGPGRLGAAAPPRDEVSRRDI